jgi:hypothetical protein
VVAFCPICTPSSMTNPNQQVCKYAATATSGAIHAEVHQRWDSAGREENFVLVALAKYVS